MNELAFCCRSGFERDGAAEVSARLQEHRVQATISRCEAGDGYFVTRLDPACHALVVLRQLASPWPVFARQMFRVFEALPALPARDRVTEIVAAVAATEQTYAGVWVETADGDRTRPLLPLCRKLEPLLSARLTELGLLDADASPALPRLHVFLIGSTSALLGMSEPDFSAPWPMGIPRLRMHREAPSRSALKLDEALLSFLGSNERQQFLRAGMSAVDLGAAPGGWSWLLAKNGLRVTAVDNARMAPAAMDTGLVEHRREDGFSYRPRRPVDWMVCDMIEKPQRIAELVSEWFARGWCRGSVFNLKLPMKKRFECVIQARDLIEKSLRGRKYDLRFRQLYHDREEVTGFYRDLRQR